MCGNNQAVCDLISATLGTDIPGVTSTGWIENFEDPYRSEGLENRLVGEHGILLGGITVHAGGDSLDNRGFGFGGNPVVQKEALTIERVRSVLVTTLATTTTPVGQEVAKLFARITEALSAQCFAPTRFELCLDALKDPFLSLTFTNGFSTVCLDTAEFSMVGAVPLDLGLPNKYTLGTKAATILAGKDNHGYSATGLALEIDGKWERICGISSFTIREDEECNAMETAPDLAAAFGDTERGKINASVAAGLVKQLASINEGGVKFTEIRFSQYSRTGGESINVSLCDAAKTRNYRLEFRA